MPVEADWHVAAEWGLRWAKNSDTLDEINEGRRRHFLPPFVIVPTRLKIEPLPPAHMGGRDPALRPLAKAPTRSTVSLAAMMLMAELERIADAEEILPYHDVLSDRINARVASLFKQLTHAGMIQCYGWKAQREVVLIARQLVLTRYSPPFPA